MVWSSLPCPSDFWLSFVQSRAQEAQLFDLLTVRETLHIFAKLRGLSRGDARRRVDELIGELRLEDHRDVACFNLSGGLKRRVMVAMAAVANPSLMVLDEPTTGLDPQSRRDLWTLMREYKSCGATILMTTHYMEEAESLCDRVGIISGGRMLALDTVSNLKSTHGFDFKITFSANGEGSGDGPEESTRTIYGKDDRALVEQVRAMGVRQFSVNRATLEDVYLALTDEEYVRDDSTDAA